VAEERELSELCDAANDAAKSEPLWVTWAWTIVLCALFLAGVVALAASYFVAVAYEVVREMIGA
jgi:hypothetical protein